MHAAHVSTAAGAIALLLGLAACDDDVLPTAPRTAATATADFRVIPDCGFENGSACSLAPACDRGLKIYDNGTPFRFGDDVCVNDTRHVFGTSFRDSWEGWALANQRTLAIDEPINWVQHLSTHNANNNIADGESSDPNQVWSLSDQLDLGARFLWLDLHWVNGAVRLCHGLEVIGLHFGCDRSDRLFGYALEEINTWLEANPDEIIMIDLEAWTEGHDAEPAEALRTFLGAKMFRATDRTDDLRWPTRRELRAMGKQVIVMGRGVDFGGINHPGWTAYRKEGRWVNKLQVTRQQGIVIACKSIPGDEGPVELVDVNATFEVVGEDRTSFADGPIFGYNTGVMDPAAVADVAACNVPLQSLDMMSASRTGPVPDVIRNRLNELQQEVDRVPDEELQRFMVWSWIPGDSGDRGNAALLEGGGGRWLSRATSEQYRFACARERSETRRLGVGIDAWPDRLGKEWRVTARTGAWHEGGRACLDEFGAEGFVYSVPRNGYMNGFLRLADATRPNIWLAYNDIETEGQWVINQRPVPHAGPDRLVECNGHNGTPVQLDGSASVDPDGHVLSYEWSGPFGQASGAQPTVLLPLGRHEIVMIVDDGFGGASADTVIIDVVDTTPPEIRSATASPDTLWPPSHRLVPAVITVDVHDLCDPNPTCRIVSVTANEPINGPGDGNTQPDWRLTGALTLELRAERSGSGAGRIYTITIECTDASGNTSATLVQVPVPHDQSGSP